MRNLRVILTLTLSLLCLAPAAFAQTVGGAIRADTEQGALTIELSATGQSGGRASGDLALTQPLELPDQDVDGTGEPPIRETSLSLRVDVDCMKVDRNRAVVGGQIRDANVQSYIGRRLLLSVEDNGEAGNGEPDRYTFGYYGSTAKTWVPTDAELEFDPGAGMTWWATDAERDDDKGISSQPLAQGDCEAVALAAYELEDLQKDGGDIQVKP